MFPARSLRLRRAPWLLLLAVLSGCTSATTRIASWYVTREIEGYLDLTREQKRALRGEVDRTIEVVRREHLPAGLNLLRMARETLARGASEPQLFALEQRYDRLLDEAVDLLAPKFARLFAGLSNEQIDHFARRARERLEQSAETRAGSASERRARDDERLLDGIESLVGGLEDEQERSILRVAHQLPDDRPARLQIDLARVAGMRAFLRGHRGAAAIEAELRRLWQTRDEGFAPGRDLATRRKERRTLLLAIDRTLSPEQRAHAVAELNERIVSLKRFALPAAE